MSIDGVKYDKLYKRLLLGWVIVSACFVYAMMPAYHKPILLLPAGVLMIVSEVLLFRLSILSFKFYQEELKPIIRFLIWATILYNAIHILYGCLWDDKFVALSYFGNPIYQPSFVLPLCFMLGLHHENFFPMFRYVLLYSIYYLLSFILFPFTPHFIGLGFLFVMAFMAYLPKSWRIVAIIVVGVYLYTGMRYNARAAVLRVVAGGVIYVFTLNPLWWNKLMRRIAFLVGVIIPLLMIRAFVVDGFSIFEYAESQKVVLMNKEEGVGEGDTRTFLYEEVFEDLTNNNSWILGKGINGTYYSDYFASKHTEGGDVENRINSEVGFLNILLKGGLVQIILYFFFLIMAIYNCLFRSENRFMLIIGLILLVHFIMLFIEEYVKYDIYNIMMWILMGMSFSPSCLEHDDDYFEEQFTAIF